MKLLNLLISFCTISVFSFTLVLSQDARAQNQAREVIQVFYDWDPGGPMNPPMCGRPTKLIPASYVNIHNDDIEIAWPNTGGFASYVIKIELYQTMYASYPSLPFYVDQFNILTYHALNNATATGFLPPNALFVTRDISTGLSQVISSNIEIRIGIYSIEAFPCPPWGPGGGPLQLTAASYCTNHNSDDILTTCGARPAQNGLISNTSYATAMQNYINCVKSFECPKSSGKHSYERTESAKIFPSPARDLISLRFENLSEGPVTIQIMNHQGQIVKTILDQHYHDMGFFSIDSDIHGLAEGHYFLLINTVKSTETKRFVKVK